MPDTPERVPLRARFWPRFFRWAVTFQVLWAAFIGFGMLLRGMSGEWQLPLRALPVLATVSGLLAFVSLLAAVRRRNLGCAEITPQGIRPYTIRHNWDIRYRWSEITSVRVMVGPFGNRWLEVIPDSALPFKLTSHPTNVNDVIDALERFAGPEHPLTRAVAEVAEAV